MNKKVTLRELVANKIVFAVLLALYYWMWARRNWSDYFMAIQYVVLIFAACYFLFQWEREKKYKKEAQDELAEHNLLRANSLSLKILVVLLVAAAFLGALGLLDAAGVGYCIVGALLVVSVVRTVAFCWMDIKGV